MEHSQRKIEMNKKKADRKKRNKSRNRGMKGKIAKGTRKTDRTAKKYMT